MEMMITLNSSFIEDQNWPKYHSNRIRGSVLMKESPHMHIWTRSALKKIGHPWKPINTSDLKLSWTSPSIIFFSSSSISSHRSEVGLRKVVRIGMKIQGFIREILRSKMGLLRRL